MDSMPIQEYLGWKEFYEIEPWGENINDLRAGSVTAAIYNVNRDTKARIDPFSPVEFIPWNHWARKCVKKSDPPVLLDDPEEQTRLIMAAVFKKTVFT